MALTSRWADCFPYLIPALPLIPRAVTAASLRRQLRRRLTSAESGREVIRPSVLSLGGLSFAALVAVVVLDENRSNTFQLAAYYLAISFLGYFAALGLQSYKFNIGIDLVGEALVDVGSLSLVAAVTALVFASSYSPRGQWTIAIISGVTFLGTSVVPMILLHRSYRKLDRGGKDATATPAPAPAPAPAEVRSPKDDVAVEGGL